MAIKIAKLKADIKRDQKVIALTLMNNERRDHMTSANDRLRNNIIKQKLTITEKTGGLPVETVVSK